MYWMLGGAGAKTRETRWRLCFADFWAVSHDPRSTAEYLWPWDSDATYDYPSDLSLAMAEIGCVPGVVPETGTRVWP